MPEERKPHYSASQLNLWHICGEAYRRRYMEGEKTPPGLHMLRGIGFHRSAARNMAQKMSSHRDLPARDIIDAGIAAYDDETKGGVTLTSIEADRGIATVIGETRDDLAEMLDCHAKAQAVCHQPTAVEETICIELPGPRDLLAVLDVATVNSVVDFKTAKRAKSQADADNSIQLSVYHAAFHARFGYAPETVSLDVVVQTKTATRRQLVTSARDDSDLAALAARINVAQRSIEAGLFAPADPSSWACSERYCPFHATCCYVGHGKKSQND